MKPRDPAALSEETRSTRDFIEELLKRSMAYYRSLEEESDRGAAVLAVAHFESRLKEAIKKAIEKLFVNCDDEYREELFARSVPIRSLSSKIDIAYAFGLYDRGTRDDLHILRRIRNTFAHSQGGCPARC